MRYCTALIQPWRWILQPATRIGSFAIRTRNRFCLHCDAFQTKYAQKPCQLYPTTVWQRSTNRSTEHCAIQTKLPAFFAHTAALRAQRKSRFLPNRPENSKKKIIFFDYSPACPYEKCIKLKMTEWHWQGKFEVLGGKNKPVVCPPQIPHGLPWGRTPLFAVEDQNMNKWAMVQLFIAKFVYITAEHSPITPLLPHGKSIASPQRRTIGRRFGN